MKTDNELSVTPEERVLIENFMGGSFYLSKDWNGLMPVVEKINALNIVDVTIKKDTCTVQFIYIPDRWFRKQIIFDNETLISVCYKAVVEFIKWYNAQPKQ